MIRVLYLCFNNSCRSQMAEGFTRHLKASQVEAYSAGIEKGRVDPRAIVVMAEAGVDISSQHSKTIDDLPDVEFDYVVTLCSEAQNSCPVFPARTAIIHHGFDDPPVLAAGAGGEDEALGHYRRVRDEIKAYVETLPGALIEYKG